MAASLVVRILMLAAMSSFYTYTHRLPDWLADLRLYYNILHCTALIYYTLDKGYGFVTYVEHGWQYVQVASLCELLKANRVIVCFIIIFCFVLHGCGILDESGMLFAGCDLMWSGLVLKGFTIIPAIIMIAGACFIPESPKWLVQNKRCVILTPTTISHTSIDTHIIMSTYLLINLQT